MFASGIFMVLVLLPLLGLTIVNAYEKHMIGSIKNELSAYSYSILAVAEVDEQQLQMPDLLLENQFNVSQSGLYARFTPQKNNQSLLWQSISLLTTDFPLNKNNPSLGQFDFFQVEYKNSTHFVYSISVSFTSNDKSFDTTLHIMKAEDQFRLLMQEFKNRLWFSLLMLMVVFIVLQLIWLKWSLTPLTTLKKELIKIEQGEAECLLANYPKELKLVTNQLNTLLKTEQNQRKRYRNALADLAHSLKTPVAVIQSQGELTATSQEQLSAINAMVEHQLKRAQNSGQFAWHLGVKVTPCLAKLSRGLTKIYRDKHLDIAMDVQPELIFKGDESDLLELLGNLLDNACKAAEQRVKLSAYRQSSLLVFQVEDDGLGIDESQRHEILQRGVRADTYKQGHGIGLAIVRDLVESYQGQLLIERSDVLGGAKFTLKF